MRSMMTRSLGTFRALASSARTLSRLGVAAVPWPISNRYSVRLSSGLGRSSMILRSKVEPPEFHGADEPSYVVLGDGVDRHEGDPRTRDTVYNGGPERERFDEREGAQVLLALDLDEPAAGVDHLLDRAPEALGQHPGWVLHR